MSYIHATIVLFSRQNLQVIPYFLDEISLQEKTHRRITFPLIHICNLNFSLLHLGFSFTSNSSSQLLQNDKKLLQSTSAMQTQNVKIRQTVNFPSCFMKIPPSDDSPPRN